MKTSSSFRQLLRSLHSAATVPPSWVLLHPGQEAYQCLWTAQSDEIVPVPHTDKIAPILERIPSGGHPATSRAPWVAELTRLFIGNSVDFENQAILPFHQGSTVVACLGWIEKSTTTKTIIANAQDIRRTFRSAWALEMARSECQALRWVLSRCDRLVAAVRPGGEILASSPAFADLLKSIQVGPRHYFHASDPELPPPLTEGIAKAPAGQVKLSKNCTARLDPIVATSDSWQPLIGIELFLEKAPPSHLPPPLSRLTRVEREIYDLIKTGATNQEIADLRGTAFTTAKNQVSAILAKMGVSRRHHLLIHEAGTITPLSQLHKPGMNGVVSSTR